MGNNKIRFIFAKIGMDFDEYAKTYDVELRSYASKPYILPKSMSEEDACKVISFIKKRAMKEGNSQNELLVVREMEKYMGVYGFEIDEENNVDYDSAEGGIELLACPKFNIKEIEGVTDLIAYDAQEKYFERSDLVERYFDWFDRRVTLKDVKNIFDDISSGDNGDEL